MTDERIANRKLIALCHAIFTKNLIGTDFDDVKVLDVRGRDFPQQPGGDGLNISFSVSAHAIGKIMDENVKDALEVLCPAKDDN